MKINDYQLISEKDLQTLKLERIGTSNLFSITTKFKGNDINETIEVDLGSVVLDGSNIRFKETTETTKKDPNISFLYNQLNVNINLIGEAVLTNNNKKYGTIKKIINNEISSIKITTNDVPIEKDIEKAECKKEGNIDAIEKLNKIEERVSKIEKVIDELNNGRQLIERLSQSIHNMNNEK